MTDKKQSDPLLKELSLCDEIIAVKCSQPVSEALKLLQSENIHTVGVLDDFGDCFVGLLTAFDIMTFLCFRSYRIDQMPEEISAIKSLDTPVGDIVQVFHEETNRIWHFSDSDPISKTFEAFTLGVHQAVVTTSDNKFKFVSQHDVVKFLVDNERVPHKSLTEVSLASGTHLTTVDPSQSALFAFRRMEVSHCSALPVVASSGRVFSTISASDVRYVSPDNIGCILQPINKFVETIHGHIEEPLTCFASESVATVAKKLLITHHRHMWVIDSDHKLMNSVTLSDVIQASTTPCK